MLRVDARQGGSCEAQARPLLSLARLRLSISWWRTDGERVDQSSGCCRHFVDRAVEGQLIRARGAVRAAQLPHELQGRGPDLLLARRGLEIRQGPNTST